MLLPELLYKPKELIFNTMFYDSVYLKDPYG